MGSGNCSGQHPQITEHSNLRSIDLVKERCLKIASVLSARFNGSVGYHVAPAPKHATRVLKSRVWPNGQHYGLSMLRCQMLPKFAANISRFYRRPFVNMLMALKSTEGENRSSLKKVNNFNSKNSRDFNLK